MSAALPAAARLKALAGCSDPDRLKAAIRELCAEFGKVTSISIMTMAEAEKRRALCFLRLESEAQEIELMSRLGVSRFGNEVLVVVDLPH
jgi:hypothetical protein